MLPRADRGVLAIWLVKPVDPAQKLEAVIQLDTEATVGDLDLLVRVNKHAAERYKTMADAAEGLETDSEYLTIKCAYCSVQTRRLRIMFTELQSDSEVNRYIKQVDDLEESVTDLEAIVKELEEWTGELGQEHATVKSKTQAKFCAEIKARRIAPRR